MVEADPGVAFGFECGRDGLVLGDALGGRGQCRAVDQPLLLLEARKVGVAEDGDPVRAQACHLAHGREAIRDGLVRQAIEQVEVDPADAAGAQALDDSGGDLEALHPVDGALDDRVEGLHPEAGAVDPVGGERVEQHRVGRARVELDREFGALGDPEPLRHGRHHHRQARRSEHAGRASAPVQVRQRQTAIEVLGDEVDFGQERVAVPVDPRLVAGQARVAAAVPAEHAAERHMEVERDGSRPGQRLEPASMLLRPDVGAELEGGGVAGVARHTAALEPADQILAHAHGR